MASKLPPKCSPLPPGLGAFEPKRKKSFKEKQSEKGKELETGKGIKV
ncbi:hypothetical protein COLO4_04765 [Corchorus olitorius]|uniref:Uncharacterized protein n=1 Tax=Corchorus olitorius TaxID=93759 RepID=A0A1R3KST9_9ROSI|nr:hypothetical protein COLO4_04765 [Corchorus olitorius]